MESALDQDTVAAFGRRRRLWVGVSIRWDWDAWWAARADDLRTLTLEQFCAKHGCSIGAASQRRAALADNRQPRHPALS